MLYCWGTIQQASSKGGAKIWGRPRMNLNNVITPGKRYHRKKGHTIKDQNQQKFKSHPLAPFLSSKMSLNVHCTYCKAIFLVVKISF